MNAPTRHNAIAQGNAKRRPGVRYVPSESQGLERAKHTCTTPPGGVVHRGYIGCVAKIDCVDGKKN